MLLPSNLCTCASVQHPHKASIPTSPRTAPLHCYDLIYSHHASGSLSRAWNIIQIEKSIISTSHISGYQPVRFVQENSQKQKQFLILSTCLFLSSKHSNQNFSICHWPPCYKSSGHRSSYPVLQGHRKPITVLFSFGWLLAKSLLVPPGSSPVSSLWTRAPPRSPFLSLVTHLSDSHDFRPYLLISLLLLNLPSRHRHCCVGANEGDNDTEAMSTAELLLPRRVEGTRDRSLPLWWVPDEAGVITFIFMMGK